MSNYKTYEKLQNFMASYVPEFDYQKGSDEPGCVLTSLCGDMMEESAKRYDSVIHKHKTQYLNLFDHLRDEPVAASKGYVQFQPIPGYQGDIMVPAKTQVLSNVPDVGEVIFETSHDMAVTIAKPTILVNTDKEKDIVVRKLLNKDNIPAFRGFSIEGENEAEHKLYLGFDEVFQHQKSLDFRMYLTAKNEELKQQVYDLFVSNQVTWYIHGLEDDVTFDSITLEDDCIHFVKEDYKFEKTLVGQRESYYLILDAAHYCPEIYIETLSISMTKKEMLPEAVYLNNMNEIMDRVYPFGFPLGIYNEISMDDPEVFSKRGAKVTLEFELHYKKHEEKLESATPDLEYKTVMKRPQKELIIEPVEVVADTVVWEYLSVTGWKRLLKDENMNSLFNGKIEGQVKIEFVCPMDMLQVEDGQPSEARLRARLVRADNIYKIPAVYSCPQINGLKLSYTYQENKQYADFAFTKNCFEISDVTKSLQIEDDIRPFYKTEHEGRCMYMGFDYSIAGMPTSMYLDLDNYSDVPVLFDVEYSTANGFRKIKLEDATGGMLGSGNMLFLIPKDMSVLNLYGQEAYYLRFQNRSKEVEEYLLPNVRGLYMNMAKIANENRITEYFYLDNLDESVDFNLAGNNLLQIKVWVQEIQDQEKKWVLWERQDGFTGKARSYEIDMAAGIMHLGKIALCSATLDKNGPQVKVEFYTYTGAVANVEAGAIHTLRNSIRYISGVTNIFPTYGGYDGYTEQTASSLTSGILRTRNRAVTVQDFEDIISQKSFGVRRIKCKNNVDNLGNSKINTTTIAILIDEYEKGVHIFSEMKEDIRKKLLECSDILPLGKNLILSQPHFVKLNVRLWIEKENMEQAYELQNKAEELISGFINPLTGGADGLGWEIGDFPRASQIIAYLRTHIWDCSIEKIIMTAQIDGKEVDVKDEFYDRIHNPFIMAISGTHIVYIDITG